MSIPEPEIVTRHVAGLHEKEDDADSDDQERADNRASPHAAKLLTIGLLLDAKNVALHARLFLHHAALILPVVAVRRAWRGIRWGVVCH